MTTGLSREEFLRNLSDSGLFSQEELRKSLGALPGRQAADGEEVAASLVAAGKLTPFQVTAVRERHFDELLIGNYQVLGRLGAGGMGTVYKARHQRMKRVVALKVLSRSVAQDEHFVQRFQREVEAVARLSHPNIVMAHDADEAEVGHFLVMEFVNGRDLATEVQERGPLPIPEAVECILQAARALGYAHGQGIIHRDIKPANLLRDVSGVVKVADLGLARFNDPLGRPPDDASALTQAGSIMGTVDFMSPEQALGSTNIDHRADVYSLGCTLYYLLTGRPPYRGSSLMATLLKHREAPIPSLCAAREEVPPALDQVFRRMLAKQPEERFASMAEVVAALEGLALPPDPQPRRPVEPAAGRPGTLPVPAVAAPAAPDTAPAPGPANQTIDLQPAGKPGTAGMTILLVEPSRAQSVIIRKYLEELGFHDVLPAPSGQRALEIARGAPPRVLISAMQLPDMTGLQLAQAMRAEPPLSSAGFVLITSQADAQQANMLSPAGNTVRLPKPFDLGGLARALAAATGSPPRENSAAAPGTARRPRVLIVDDSAAARGHIRGVLAGLGVRHTVEAADGAEAVALLEKEAFDLVVTDYHMPRLDGRGLIAFIRQCGPTPSVPVIVVTTETDPARLEAVRQLGVSAICDKSFNPEAVRGLVERLG
jgi:CheY-like chemotaxis protein/tRNA A-37 threonylcarbamoyl transferase component Bud32